MKKDCLAFDINLGCSAYVYGIYILSGLIESGAIKKALLLVGDVCTSNVADALLFGDAGSATLLEYGDDSSIYGIMRSDGAGFRALYTPYGGLRHPIDSSCPELLDKKTVMDGAKVFTFTIEEVPELLREFNQKCERDWDYYDYVILHQANLMILNYIQKELRLPSEKVPVSIQKYGNVNGASVPITIVDLVQGLSSKEELSLLLSGFGVGLSYGVVSLKLDPNVVLPMVYTDYMWNEEFGEKE